MNSYTTNPDAYTDEEVMRRIERLTHGLMFFWKTVQGWAPVEAAGLLNKSMLERQSSLATSLSRWMTAESDGDLILAWANLGSLVEGAMKLHLSVYYKDYLADPDAVVIKGKIQDPDGLMLERLRHFFAKKIWPAGSPHLAYVEMVQARRNAIHAFKESELGTFGDFKNAIRRHLEMLRTINNMLPYPSDEYQPREF